MNIKEKIIDYCVKNRISTTEVADALGKKGVYDGIKPMIQGKYCVGEINTVFAGFKSNYQIHEKIREIKDGSIVMIFTHNCENRAVIGDLISKFLILYRGAKAVIVDGLVRDIASIKRENFPVWSKGYTPLGCHNRKTELFPLEKQKEIEESYNGAIAVCDDGGVTIIKNHFINQSTLDNLAKIEMQEDIWFYCLDTLKWDTKQIVCDKKYLTQKDLLPKAYLKSLEELKKPLD
tara:strand:- start:118 stop:819 length:702 start_codon:yes stop_codon:yes gene_type:complete